MTTVQERAAEVLGGWDTGMYTQIETVERLVELATAEEVDALVAALPEHWRDSLVARFYELAHVTPATELFDVVGAVYRWGHEPDPERRAEMIRDHERAVAARRAHLHAVIIPAVRIWLRTHS
jgi:hypothetical protein